ncbi:hypothetical protein [Paenibacillus sp. 481]|uniref:hypothetical protein n=1 Tax=Paenibacillus sp. 481 TaxID=2835869 RepID=UPI001E64D9D5|nr:hypothetical protein [Paenibacillus sp. 481]UHA71893.1 hypothetical protein KIK04_14230 [Paenibacillus sp. 481]
MKKVTVGLLSMALVFSVAGSAFAANATSVTENSEINSACPDGDFDNLKVGKNWPIPVKGDSYNLWSDQNITLSGHNVKAKEPGNADLKVYKKGKCIARYYLTAYN